MQLKMKFLFRVSTSVLTVGGTIIAKEWQKKMVRFLVKSLECSVAPYNCSLTVNARINARDAYLIFWVERGWGGGGGGGALILFFKFRPQTNIFFISSKHEL